jgi:hypothetical protein
LLQIYKITEQSVGAVFNRTNLFTRDVRFLTAPTFFATLFCKTASNRTVLLKPAFLVNPDRTVTNRTYEKKSHHLDV